MELTCELTPSYVGRKEEHDGEVVGVAISSMDLSASKPATAPWPSSERASSAGRKSTYICTCRTRRVLSRLRGQVTCVPDCSPRLAYLHLHALLPCCGAASASSSAKSSDFPATRPFTPHILLEKALERRACHVFTRFLHRLSTAFPTGLANSQDSVKPAPPHTVQYGTSQQITAQSAPQPDRRADSTRPVHRDHQLQYCHRPASDRTVLHHAALPDKQTSPHTPLFSLPHDNLAVLPSLPLSLPYLHASPSIPRHGGRL